MSAEARDIHAAPRRTTPPEGGRTGPGCDALAGRFGRIGISAVAAAAAQLKAKPASQSPEREQLAVLIEADAA